MSSHPAEKPSGVGTAEGGDPAGGAVDASRANEEERRLRSRAIICGTDRPSSSDEVEDLRAQPKPPPFDWLKTPFVPPRRGAEAVREPGRGPGYMWRGGGGVNGPAAQGGKVLEAAGGCVMMRRMWRGRVCEGARGGKEKTSDVGCRVWVSCAGG